MAKPTRASRRAEARAGAREPAARAGSRAARRSGAPSTRGATASFINRNAYAVLGGIVALNLLFAFLTFMPQPHTGGDSANYMTLGRSLLQNHTYTDLYDPIQPPHTKYPPVFPMILALGMAVGLTTWVQLKIVMALIGTAAVAFTFLFIRRRGRPVLAAGVALLLVLSAGVLDQSHWLLSDVPFWLFTMIALLAFDRLRANDWTRLAVAVAAAVLAYFTRSAGLPLVLACGLWLLWRRRWPQLAAFLVVLGPLALLWWLRAQNTGGVAYTQEFWLVDPYMPQLGRIGIAQLFQRMALNAQKYATIHIPILLAGRTGALLTLMTLIITGVGVYGWVTRLRRVMVAEMFMPLYIGLVLVWPAVWSGERFIMPVFPLLLYYAGAGAARIMRRIAPRHVVAAGAAVVTLIALLDVPALNASIANGRSCTNAYQRGEKYPCLLPPEQSYFNAAIWAQTALPADAVVLSRKPRLFYEISKGVRGTTYPMARDAKTFFALADSVHARYVIYDRLTSLADYYLAPVLLARPQAFCVLQTFGSDGTMGFGIMTGASSMPDQPVAPGTEPSFKPCDNSFFAASAQPAGR